MDQSLRMAKNSTVGEPTAETQAERSVRPETFFRALISATSPQA